MTQNNINGLMGRTQRTALDRLAAAWFTRLRDPDLSLEDTLEWQRWIKEDKRHAEAFARIEELMGTLRLLPRASRPSDRDTVNGGDAAAAQSGLKGLWQTKPFVVGSALILLAIAIAVTMLVRQSVLFSELTADVYTTAAGEHRVIELGEGSTVTLTDRSKVEVALAANRRRVELIRGKAHFSVAKGTPNELKILAGGATLLALDTTFDVQLHGKRTQVAVSRGSLLVQPTSRLVVPFITAESKPAFAAIRLHAGQQTEIGEP